MREENILGNFCFNIWIANGGDAIALQQISSTTIRKRLHREIVLAMYNNRFGEKIVATRSRKNYNFRYGSELDKHLMRNVFFFLVADTRRKKLHFWWTRDVVCARGFAAALGWSFTSWWVDIRSTRSIFPKPSKDVVRIVWVCEMIEKYALKAFTYY